MGHYINTVLIRRFKQILIITNIVAVQLLSFCRTHTVPLINGRPISDLYTINPSQTQLPSYYINVEGCSSCIYIFLDFQPTLIDKHWFVHNRMYSEITMTNFGQNPVQATKTNKQFPQLKLWDGQRRRLLHLILL